MVVTGAEVVDSDLAMHATNAVDMAAVVETTTRVVTRVMGPVAVDTAAAEEATEVDTEETKGTNHTEQLVRRMICADLEDFSAVDEKSFAVTFVLCIYQLVHMHLVSPSHTRCLLSLVHMLT